MKKRILLYTTFFLSLLALISVILSATVQFLRHGVDTHMDLPEKTAYYLRQHANYDLLFLGDSRTYCAMHPELLDPLMGTRSLNLSHWAHWLPTQYPQARDLAAALPAGTLVIWTIGEQNFEPGQILDKYPIGLTAVPEYLGFGIGLGQMVENLTAFNPVSFLYARRGVLLGHVRELADRPLLSAGPGVQNATAAQERELARAALARPGVARAEVQAPQGRPVAVAQFMRGGGYLLEELDPTYFRTRQGQDSPGPRPEAGLVPDPSRWALFLAMLDLFRQRGMRVVVNVLEEAPHIYAAAPGRKQAARAFMDGPVRREVEAQGFAFIRADLDQLTDADYFDYNHLNSRGAERYSQLLAAVLRPHLLPSARP